MILSTRFLLVTLLVLLQFIAPLIHAHTSEQVVSQGIHLPYLEVYGRSPSVQPFLCKAWAFCADVDGQVVGIHAGLSRDTLTSSQRLQKKLLMDVHHDAVIATQVIISPPLISLLFNKRLAQVSPLVVQLARVAQSPRAPPHSLA